MTKLDEAIANTAYILDCLILLRNIQATGNCNSCAIQKKCGCAPKWGEMVRYNCPLYLPKKEESNVSESNE